MRASRPRPPQLILSPPRANALLCPPQSDCSRSWSRPLTATGGGASSNVADIRDGSSRHRPCGRGSGASVPRCHSSFANVQAIATRVHEVESSGPINCFRYHPRHGKPSPLPRIDIPLQGIENSLLRPPRLRARPYLEATSNFAVAIVVPPVVAAARLVVGHPRAKHLLGAMKIADALLRSGIQVG